MTPDRIGLEASLASVGFGIRRRASLLFAACAVRDSSCVSADLLVRRDRFALHDQAVPLRAALPRGGLPISGVLT